MLKKKRFGANTTEDYYKLMEDSEMVLTPPGSDIMVPMTWGLVKNKTAPQFNQVMQASTQSMQASMQAPPIKRVLPDFMMHAPCVPPVLTGVDNAMRLGLDLVVWGCCMYRDSDRETVYRLMLDGVTPSQVKGVILHAYKRVTGNDTIITNYDGEPAGIWILRVGSEDKKKINYYGEAHLGCVKGNHNLIPSRIYYRLESNNMIAFFTMDQWAFYYMRCGGGTEPFV